MNKKVINITLAGILVTMIALLIPTADGTSNSMHYALSQIHKLWDKTETLDAKVNSTSSKVDMIEIRLSILEQNQSTEVEQTSVDDILSDIGVEDIPIEENTSKEPTPSIDELMEQLMESHIDPTIEDKVYPDRVLTITTETPSVKKGDMIGVSGTSKTPIVTIAVDFNGDEISRYELAGNVASGYWQVIVGTNDLDPGIYTYHVIDEGEDKTVEIQLTE